MTNPDPCSNCGPLPQNYCIDPTGYSVIPPTGAYGNCWKAGGPSQQSIGMSLPQGKYGAISVAGWTPENMGFIQQTFLGASIRNFNVNAGFGDASSNLSVQLVNDEYNKSDQCPYGKGDDVYHNGLFDLFQPPAVGSPVFFKFGKTFATIEQAWTKTYDDLYGTLFSEEFPCGRNHFVFGGILQSYTQNQGPEGNPVYSAQITDPREILSNCSIILKNYAGSIFGNKNYFNVYGFLEYDVSDELLAQFKSSSVDGYVKSGIESIENWTNESVTTFKDSEGKFIKMEDNKLRKLVDFSTGDVDYYGNDMYRFDGGDLPQFFPITGQGMARVCDQGIPWYRVRQALNALFNYYGDLPEEYVQKGFGGPINFRGYNYVVDFSGIPLQKIPQMYFLDFEKIDLLSLVQELCDVISHDFIVTLLPVLNHPACGNIVAYNNYWSAVNPVNIITGIIRIDAIDRSIPPSPGSIQAYLNTLELQGVKVENKDLGYELSNDMTDNMVVGAQEVEMYYFSGNKDRDNLQLRKQKHGKDNSFEQLQADQWKLETSLKQQILPFYGFLAKDVVTIPRGFGSYQQIMLDSSGLNAYGVGNYYIATEMELRAASISYENWARFLTQYNELYMEEIGENAVFFRELASTVPENEDKYADTELGGLFNADEIFKNRQFAVTVPRCVFIPDKNYVDDEGYPASPCAPPYGYPLYYKRAQKIGIPEAGFVGFQNAMTECASNFSKLRETAGKRDELLKMHRLVEQQQKKLEAQLISLNPGGYAAKKIKEKIEIAKKRIDELNKKLQKALDAEKGAAVIREVLVENKRFVKALNRLSAQSLRNAKKVYNFLKNIADKHLGRTYLIKIPKGCNIDYKEKITLSKEGIQVNNIVTGPFGFRPQPITSEIGYYSIPENRTSLFSSYRNKSRDKDVFAHYLDFNRKQYTYGALKNNFNPITDKWEFNYIPEPQGGFFNYDIFNKNLSLGKDVAAKFDKKNLPFVQRQLLAPVDLTNFIDNGKVKCYVRYDHSELLDLSMIGSENFTQQKIVGGSYIPDVMEELNNIEDQKFSFQDKIVAEKEKSADQEPPLEETVAFVTCDIDSQFYMIPKFSTKKTPVYGRTYSWVPNFAPVKMIEIVNGEGCKEYVPSQPYAYPIFRVGSYKDDAPPEDEETDKCEKRCSGITDKIEKLECYLECVNSDRMSSYDIKNLTDKFLESKSNSGGYDGTRVEITDFDTYYNETLKCNLISTSKEKLNSDHVYAIITVPGRIMPTYNQRYLDGPAQAMNGSSIKHALCMDVVRGMVGFEKPAPIKPEETFTVNCDIFNFKQLNAARAAQKNANKLAGFANPELNIGFTSPSPVYPDLVALPLMSMERCYGPWFSSSFVGGGDPRVRYSDIGGKVDYIKDENLAPWNYAGYQLMNQAGSLQAQFGNSLKLFSERGGFVIPDAPMGISIARVLQKGGPLITSINVDISENKISTKVQMDLYTARFGKLQKQKEGAIARIIRERQKITDQNNSMIRKGLGKSSSGRNLFKEAMNAGGANIRAVAEVSSNYITESSLVTGKTVQTNIVASVIPQTTDVVPEGSNEPVKTKSYNLTAAIQSPAYTAEVLGIFEDEDDFRKAYQASAGGNIADIVLPYSNDMGNPYMASKPYLNLNAINERIF